MLTTLRSANTLTQRFLFVPFTLLCSWSVFCAIVFGLSCTITPGLLRGQEQELQPPKIEAGELIELDETDAEDVPAPAAVLGQFGLDAKKMLAAKKFQLSQIFAVEIDELKQVCELDQKQVAKLRVAAKGAVKKSATKWQKTAGQRFGGVVDPRQVDEDQQPASDQPDIVIKDADEIDEMTMQMVVMNNMGNPFQSDDPRDDKFWLNTLSSVLTDEQSAKFKGYRLERETAKRDALVDSTVRLLTIELALTDEQKLRLAELVTPPMLNAKISCPSFFEPYVLTYYASKVDEKKLKELLSPAQHQKWKIFMAPAKQVGQMMEMENMQMQDLAQNDFDLLIQLDRMIDIAIRRLIHVFNELLGHE